MAPCEDIALLKRNAFEAFFKIIYLFLYCLVGARKRHPYRGISLRTIEFYKLNNASKTRRKKTEV